MINTYELHLAAEGKPQNMRVLSVAYANSEGNDTRDLSSVVWEASENTSLILQPATDGTCAVITSGTGDLGSVNITYHAKATSDSHEVMLLGGATINVVEALPVVIPEVAVEVLASDEQPV
jgi:hypothetical protein